MGQSARISRFLLMSTVITISATGTAYAHTISNSLIEGDAYYQNISGTTVWGTMYPGSTDQASSTLPISDEYVTAWESAAAGGGIISSPCPYTINSDVTLGPVKIGCNLVISGDPIITLLGPVWVSGNISVSNTATIRIDPSLGKTSIPIVADNLSNRLTSSKINLTNSVVFEDSGTDGSYILLISQNNSAESGGAENAITIGNSVSGELLLYSGHGTIQMNNSANLREVTGYKVSLANTANVVYQTGLASLLFSAGPGGSFSISLWREIN